MTREDGELMVRLSGRMRWLVVVAVVGACGGTAKAPSGSSGYMTAGAVASRLAPLGCQPSADDTRPGAGQPVAEVECSVSGEHVTVEEYRTPHDLTAALPVLRRLGCTPGLGPLTFVEGSNWMVAARSRPSADAVRGAAGGRVVSGGC